MTGQQRAAGSQAARHGTGRSQRTTMADLAKHLGVSRALVSIVLRGAEGASDATRERVLQAAAELGYRPDSLAQGLRRNRSRTLGVLFSLRRPFEVELVEHMYPAAQQHGYDLLLGPFTPGRGQDAVVDELLRYRCAGLIVVGPELHARDLEPLAEEVAVVEVGRGVTRGSVDVIRNDDAIGTRQAVDHLVGLGHHAIAYIDGGDNPGAEDRRAGYRTAMTDHGLTADIQIISGGYDEDDGATAAQVLLTRVRCPPPSSPRTTSAPSAPSTPCCVQASPCPATYRSSATTTPGSDGFPGSTSPPSARTSRSRPKQPSEPSSSDWINRTAGRRTSH